MEGWVDLVDWLHTQMVYASEYDHPSIYSPGPLSINFIGHTNVVNHYTTPPTKLFAWYALSFSHFRTLHSAR